MVRDIITVDEGKCNGCGECVRGCPEGAIQVIDGKARLVSDLFCDGLGACVGSCPVDAMKIERRDAEPYSEESAMENVARGGANVIAAHLRHLSGHGETALLETALNWLRDRKIEVPDYAEEKGKPTSCSGKMFTPHRSASALDNWPIQLALINPAAQIWHDADVLIAADCSAFACGTLRADFLAGKKLIILCPKLDDRLDSYRVKLRQLIENGVKSITVLRMVVPCCAIDVLLDQVREASDRKGIPVEVKTLSIEGDLICG